MNGKVIPHTPLAVDFWKVRRCSHVRIFFLSHMHSDHTVCLTSTWCHRPIYCSQVTAKLLTLKLKVKEQWIHPLEVGDPTMLPLDDIGKEWFTVTLIDANHCPGAVMFLFQGYFGCILYTGDFRYTPSMLQEPCLKTGITIDVLYLDNTNSNPTRTLPSRQQATQQIKEIIQSHPSHRVVIGLYTLGKESLLVELAMEFKTWVEVSYERLETLRVLDLPDVFTTEPGVGRIRAVEQSQIRSANLVQWNREWPTLAILPTSRPLVSFHPNVHVVPYSDHSSYQELEDFVSALQPTSLVPIVGTCIPDTMHALLPGRTRHEVLVPESVQSCMRRQTDVQLRFPELHVLSRRTQRRGPPRGVVFESPDKGTCAAPGDTREAGSKDATEEDMDPEVDGEGSDGSPVALAMDPSPVKDKRGVRDVRSLNVVHNVPEGRRTPESVQSSRLNHSDVASTEVVRKSIGNTAQMQALPLEGNTASRGGTESNDIAVCSEEETDSTVSFEMSTNGSASTELCDPSAATLSGSMEDWERILLQHLPFTAEDLTGRFVPLDRSKVQRFSITPFLEDQFNFSTYSI